RDISPESFVVMFFLLLHSLLLLRLLSLAVFYHFGVSTFYTNFIFMEVGSIPERGWNYSEESWEYSAAGW
ncbi:hypothetical protein, partial [Alkalicoccus saliphilus]